MKTPSPLATIAAESNQKSSLPPTSLHPCAQQQRAAFSNHHRAIGGGVDEGGGEFGIHGPPHPLMRRLSGSMKFMG